MQLFTLGLEAGYFSSLAIPVKDSPAGGRIGFPVSQVVVSVHPYDFFSFYPSMQLDSSLGFARIEGVIPKCNLLI